MPSPGSEMKLQRAVWLFVALHLALAVGYALVTPYRQSGLLLHQGGAYARDIGAPDERQHVNLVAHIADGNGLPVFRPKDPNLYESYQSHQPPLFYILASGAYKIGGGNVAERATGLSLRFFNAGIGALGVLGVYFFVLWGFRSAHAALAAAAFAALLPMNVALSGAVSNDPLLFFLCSWCLAFTARAVLAGWDLRHGLLVGSTLTLALLTKTSAVALLPVVGLALLLPGEKGASLKGRKAAAAAIAFGFLLAVPWWARNMRLYGDPLAMRAFTEAFQGSPQADLFIREFGSLDYWVTGSDSGTGVLWWTLRSFFGAFGYMDIFFAKSLYVVLALAVGILALAALKPPGRGSAASTGAVKSPVTLLSWLFFAVIVALFFRFNAQYFQGQARYILPAIAPISAAIGLGATSLFRRRPGYAPWTLAATLLTLNLYALSILPSEFEKRKAYLPDITFRHLGNSEQSAAEMR